MGNNKACRVFGKGTVMIQMFDGWERTLTDVRYISDLKRNLISLGMLGRNGCTFAAKDDFMKVAKGLLVVMNVVRRNGIYTLFGKTVIRDSTVVSNSEENKAKLWHKKLGHISERGLQELSKQK